jgi:hypothetical protein
MPALVQFFDKNYNQLIPESIIIVEMIHFYNMQCYNNKLPLITLSEINNTYKYVRDNAIALNKIYKSDTFTPQQVITFLTTDHNGVYDCPYDYMSPLLQTTIFILSNYNFKTSYNQLKQQRNINTNNTNISTNIINNQVIPKKLNFNNFVNITNNE